MSASWCYWQGLAAIDSFLLLQRMTTSCSYWQFLAASVWQPLDATDSFLLLLKGLAATDSFQQLLAAYYCFWQLLTATEAPCCYWQLLISATDSSSWWQLASPGCICCVTPPSLAAFSADASQNWNSGKIRFAILAHVQRATSVKFASLKKTIVSLSLTVTAAVYELFLLTRSSKYSVNDNFEKHYFHYVTNICFVLRVYTLQ